MSSLQLSGINVTHIIIIVLSKLEATIYIKAVQLLDAVQLQHLRLLLIIVSLHNLRMYMETLKLWIGTLFILNHLILIMNIRLQV